MTTETLERALAVMRDVVANVRADQLDNPTPCASWDVRAALNHVIGNSYYTAALMNDTPETAFDPSVDLTGDDMVATYDEGIRQSVASFNVPGAMDKTLTLPFGEMSAVGWMGIATTDAFMHAWDVAKATGQPTDLDPELAAQILEQARGFIQPAFRGADTQMPFGPEHAAPAGASNADRLAAFLGREV